MIRLVRGDLLAAEVDALVNTVNTEGVMGKGIALQFKRAFPGNFKAYEQACKRREVTLGEMFVFDAGGLTRPRYIINFPTKGHWRSKTSVEDLESGLIALVRVVRDKEIRSIAVPPLGCGNGGLLWRDVKPLIEDALSALEDVDVLLYEPAGAPLASEMRTATRRPRMSPARAAVVGLLAIYLEPGAGASRLEVQKLLYLLQVAGQPLKLNYSKEQYGPYAEQVNHVLEGIEGHFVSGYGDRSSPSPLSLLPGAEEEADAFMRDHPKMRESLDNVVKAIEGFETPYGLELLATVHWVATTEPGARTDLAVTTKLVQAWSKRKARLFTERHIAVAWGRLTQIGWLPDGA